MKVFPDPLKNPIKAALLFYPLFTFLHDREPILTGESAHRII